MKLTRASRWLTFAVLMLSFSAASPAQIAVGVSVRVGPPALPVYAQPICPGPGYLWTPGYWGWNDDAGYYWVPGTWVVAPVGMLWTPGYWGWGGGFYAWHPGYWGPHIGFYGGINYGFGYGGVGFVGGEWRHGAFFYNTAVMRVDSVHVTNVYVNRTVIVNNESHVAFNGGEGGVPARPSAEEERFAHEPHTAALAAQTRHEHEASRNRENFASENHGRPAIAATARPGEFHGKGVVKAQAAGGSYHAPAMSPKEARATSTHAENRAPSRPLNANSNNSRSSSNRNTPANAEHNTSRPAGNAGHNNASRPEPNAGHQSASRPAPQHHESAPQSKPSKQEQHNSPPPKGDHHRGR